MRHASGQKRSGRTRFHTATLMGLMGLLLWAAPAASEANFDASWLGYDPARKASSAAAELEAELVRRVGGEWVIVSLGPLRPEPPAAPAPPASPASSSTRARASVTDYVGVQTTLREYEHAMEKRDAARMSRVWIMNPAELAHIEWLFEESASISVRIDDSNIQIDGDQASMRFAQTLVASRRSASPHFRRRSTRTLFASDHAGSWEIDAVLEKN